MHVVDLLKKAAILIEAQRELLDVYESQVQDLSMMSKIELGDDVIDEITRLKKLINETENRDTNS